MSNIATQSDRLFASTKKKIIIVVAVISMLVMLLFSGIVMTTYQVVLFRSVDMELEQYRMLEKNILKNFFAQSSPSILPFPEDRPQESPYNGILDDYAGEGGMRTVRFLFMDSQLIWSSSGGYYPPGEHLELNELEENEIFRFSIGNERFRGFAVTQNNMTIVTGINVGPEYASISKILLALMIGLFAAFVVIVIVANHYSKKIVAPLKDAYVKQAYFVQDASHEMRTPLAVIRGKMELMAQSPNDEIQEHSEELSDIISELSAMEKMNSSLLMLSREDALVNHDISSFGLYDMLSELSDELFSMLAEAQGKSFSFSVTPQDIVVSWDYSKMKRAFTILLDNAFKYTAEGDEITITAEQSRDNVIIRFYDSGRGIRQEDLPRIFDRFYRADDVRAQDISGSGIGLSLLSLLGNNLGFKIKVSSEYSSFTEFTIIAPINMK